MNNEKITDAIKSESETGSERTQEVICGECYKKGSGEILMNCYIRRKDSQEYGHDTIIAEYKCDGGHSFRLVTFL